MFKLCHLVFRRQYSKLGPVRDVKYISYTLKELLERQEVKIQKLDELVKMAEKSLLKTRTLLVVNNVIVTIIGGFSVLSALAIREYMRNGDLFPTSDASISPGGVVTELRASETRPKPADSEVPQPIHVAQACITALSTPPNMLIRTFYLLLSK